MAADLSAELVMHRIKSLSSHKKIMELPSRQRGEPASSWANAQNRHAPEAGRGRGPESCPSEDYASWRCVQLGRTRVPAHMLELHVREPDLPEAFNKQVYKLIEFSLEEQRKRQMSAQWCPWF